MSSDLVHKQIKKHDLSQWSIFLSLFLLENCSEIAPLMVRNNVVSRYWWVLSVCFCIITIIYFNSWHVCKACSFGRILTKRNPFIILLWNAFCAICQNIPSHHLFCFVSILHAGACKVASSWKTLYIVKIASVAITIASHIAIWYDIHFFFFLLLKD